MISISFSKIVNNTLIYILSCVSLVCEYDTFFPKNKTKRISQKKAKCKYKTTNRAHESVCFSFCRSYKSHWPVGNHWPNNSNSKLKQNSNNNNNHIEFSNSASMKQLNIICVLVCMANGSFVCPYVLCPSLCWHSIRHEVLNSTPHTMRTSRLHACVPPICHHTSLQPIAPSLLHNRVSQRIIGNSESRV